MATQPTDFAEELRKRRGEQPTTTVDFASQLRARREGKDGLLTADEAAALPSGGADPMTRFNIASADTDQERLNALRQQFPEGQFARVIDEEGVSAFIPKPGAKPVSLEGNFIVDGPLPGINPNEVVTDIAEFFGPNTGAVVGEIIGLVLFRTRGGGAATKAATQGFTRLKDWALRVGAPQVFAGSALGHLSQEGFEEWQGINEEDLDAMTGRAAWEGVFGVTGQVAGGIFARLMNAHRSGIVGVDEPGAKVMRAFDQLGIPWLPSQVTSNPIVQRLGSLAEQVLPSLIAVRRGQSVNVVNRARQMIDRKALPEFVDELGQAHEQQRRFILRELQKGDDLDLTGQQVADALEAYATYSGGMVNLAYKTARGLSRRRGGVQFDLTPVQTRAKAFMQDGQIRMRDGSIVGISDLDPELRTSLQFLQQVNPRVMDLETTHALDQIKALRGKLHAHTIVKDGRTTNTNRVARILYEDLNRILDNPIAGDEVITRAYRKASRLARQRFDTMEKAVVQKFFNDDNYSGLAANLLRHGQQSNLQYLRSLATRTKPESWRRVQDEFSAQLIRGANSGEEIVRRLDQFDTGTLNELMSPDAQQAARTAARQYDKLLQANIIPALTRQNRARLVVRDIISTRSSVGIDVLKDLAKSSPKMRRATRAALLDEFTNAVVARSAKLKGPTINNNAIEATLKEWNEYGLLGLVEPADKRLMRNLQVVAPYLEPAADAGSALSGAQTISGLRGFSAEAFKNLIESWSIGRVYTSETAKRILFGSGKPMRGTEAWNTLGALWGTLAHEAEMEEKEEQ